jgi:hypothetical protein
LGLACTCLQTVDSAKFPRIKLSAASGYQSPNVPGCGAMVTREMGKLG